MGRSSWAAVGAGVAVTLGVGGVGLVSATVDSGDRPVTVTIESERILDTRTNLGLAGRFTSNAPRDLQVTGSVAVASGGSKTVVPSDALAVLVNVTVVGPDSAGFLSLRPGGAAGAPTTSTVNFAAGAIEPNAATVDLGPGGKMQIWVKTAATAGTSDVLVDVVGYTVDHTHDDRYGVGKVATATGTSVQTTSSTTYSNIADATAIATTEANGRLLITFSTETECSTTGSLDDWCQIQVLVDGTPAAPSPVIYESARFLNAQGASGWASHSHQFVSDPLSAGQHTVTVQFRVDTTGATFSIDQWTLSVLPVIP